jgi:hypothetical protein
MRIGRIGEAAGRWVEGGVFRQRLAGDVDLERGRNVRYASRSRTNSAGSLDLSRNLRKVSFAETLLATIPAS